MKLKDLLQAYNFDELMPISAQGGLQFVDGYIDGSVQEKDTL